MAQEMPNVIELYEAAAHGFRQTLAGVNPDQMMSPTPCNLWNVQQLIIHNLNNGGFVQGMLTGNPTVDGQDVFGSLPDQGALAALDDEVAAVVKLLKVPGALEKEVDMMGSTPVTHFMMFKRLVAGRASAGSTT